ncbi:MAG: aromatic ring-hydroxylating dioxygenase subunit alpha [Alphaproteobacteria bacterium]
MAIGDLVRADRVHSRVYTDADLFAAERRLLFSRTWLFLCHESQIPQPGDFVLGRLAGRSVIAARQRDGSVAAMFNRCGHRGAQVCQQEQGRTARFRCPYHGWSYALDGTLAGIPMRAGYAEDFDLHDPELALQRVPRIDTYRGFVFASLAAEGPDLRSFLGFMASAIDDMVDRAPDGELEMAGGVHKHVFAANWKLQVENLQDYIHPTFAHESSNAAPKTKDPSGKELRTDDIMTANAGADFEWIERAGVWAYPGGHSCIGGLPVKQGFPPEAEARYRAALIARNGEARASEILAVSRHQAIVYPTLSVQAAYQMLKVIQPVSVDHTEILVYPFRLKGAPAEYHRASVTFTNAANAPASPILTDDLAIYERAQRQMRESPGWIRFANGLGRDAPDNRGGMHGPGYSELAMRNQFKAWAQYMGADAAPGAA